MGSIRDEAIRVTQEVNRRMVERYNRRIQRYVFKKRDRLWMRSQTHRAKGKELLHRWSGPGTITWIGEWGAAEVEDVYGERGCTTLMILNLILTDRSGGPLSRSGRGAVLVNYGLNNSKNAYIY